MKHDIITHGYQSARIYKNQYKPTLNVFRFLRSVLGVLITGQGLAANKYHRRK